ncbi:uncharacterized protein LTR77_006833 [Saxophila tyrrhenica]|uniref:Uncharacterized protein n=1 Tax=Saxophila tyrrhenica TaxID=1690608 RepID=A0AAV9P6M5_9PEZI|nr:hypothetical protein LTR77_006833 [Saxophila tyrrhenica]
MAKTTTPVAGLRHKQASKDSTSTRAGVVKAKRGRSTRSTPTGGNRKLRGETPKSAPAEPDAADSSAGNDGGSREEGSPFLGLPPELRNNVYAFVAAETPAYLRKGHTSHLISGSPLARVNRQIREEFVSSLTLEIKVIRTEMRNFDYSHVVNFLNRLNDVDLYGLSNAETPTSRLINIRLVLTRLPKYDRESLLRWLKRLEHPTKRGAEIVTTVDVSDNSLDAISKRWLGGDHIETTRLRLRDSARELDRSFLIKLKDGRAKKEVRSILTAVLNFCDMLRRRQLEIAQSKLGVQSA